jgi:hypothetical protein
LIESPEEFERVLGLGLGRAILFLRQHDATPYRDVILDACTHWTGYDQQVEGTRTPYLLDVLDATGELERYVEPILAAFRTTADERDQEQLVRLVAGLAEARSASSRTGCSKSACTMPTSICVISRKRGSGEMRRPTSDYGGSERTVPRAAGNRCRGGAA